MKKYENLDIEVIVLDGEDIITNSGNDILDDNNTESNSGNEDGNVNIGDILN